MLVEVNIEGSIHLLYFLFYFISRFFFQCNTLNTHQLSQDK